MQGAGKRRPYNMSGAATSSIIAGARTTARASRREPAMENFACMLSLQKENRRISAGFR